jgi:hypothetical protein
MSPSDEDEENEFYDAMEETAQPNFILKIPLGHRRPSSAGSQVSRKCFSSVKIAIFGINWFLSVFMSGRYNNVSHLTK